MGLKKMGAMWLRQGKKGTFMSGQVEIGGVKHSFMVFKNNRKQDGSKHPDYEMFQDDGDQAPQQGGSFSDDSTIPF